MTCGLSGRAAEFGPLQLIAEQKALAREAKAKAKGEAGSRQGTPHETSTNSTSGEPEATPIIRPGARAFPAWDPPQAGPAGPAAGSGGAARGAAAPPAGGGAAAAGGDPPAEDREWDAMTATDSDDEGGFEEGYARAMAAELRSTAMADTFEKVASQMVCLVTGALTLLNLLCPIVCHGFVRITR